MRLARPHEPRCSAHLNHRGALIRCRRSKGHELEHAGELGTSIFRWFSAVPQIPELKHEH